MTPEEFAALPPTVQRKCFSSSERLTYSHPGPIHVASKSNSYTHRARDFEERPVRFLSLCPRAKRPFTFLLRSHHQDRAPAPLNLTSANLTPEFVRFYDHLPEKIKRGHFSAHERDLLDTHTTPLVRVSETERGRWLNRRNTNRSLPSLRSDLSGSASSTFSSDDLATLETEADMDKELLSTFKWIDESEPDLSLDYYQTHLASQAEVKTKSRPSLPFRRNRSYTQVSLRGQAERGNEQRSGTADGPKARKQPEQWQSRFAPTVPPVPRLPETKTIEPMVVPLPTPPPMLVQAEPRLSSSLPPPPPVFAAAEPRLSSSSARRKFEPAGLGGMPQQQQQQPSLESSPATAEHYLSPEARLKLRLYLATPARFDEALEHGFPAQAQANHGEPGRPSISSRSCSHGSHGSRPQPTHGMTFLHDETTPDLSVAEEMQEHSRKGSSFYTSSDSPPPSSPRFNEDHVDPPGLEKEYEADPYLGAAWSGAGREMTLRMTLTRPDLRADESVLYPTAAPYVWTPPPRTRFIGGPRKERGAAVATVDANGAASMDVARNPLSLDDLFNDQLPPLPTERTEKRTFRKLFSRKW